MRVEYLAEVPVSGGRSPSHDSTTAELHSNLGSSTYCHPLACVIDGWRSTGEQHQSIAFAQPVTHVFLHYAYVRVARTTRPDFRGTMTEKSFDSSPKGIYIRYVNY